MKKLLLILSIALSFTGTASHLLGGQIYWECQGNGDYVFTLSLYRDCNGITLGTNSQTINTDAPCGNITLNFLYTENLIDSCYDPSQQVPCGFSPPGQFNAGEVQKYVYKSDPITISGAAPISGWTFNWSSCCRPASNVNSFTNNYFIKSKMYQNPTGGCLYDSPRFLNEPLTVFGKNTSFSSLASTFTPDDSIAHHFTNGLSGVNTSINYNSGYSPQQPFPDSSESSLNQLVTMDTQTGLLNFGVKSMGLNQPPHPSFASVVKAESWRNGQLYSEINRDVVVFFDSAFSQMSNLPKFVIDSLSASHPISKLKNNLYHVSCFAGDTVNLEFLGVDQDINANGQAQILTFDAKSYYLDSTWSGTSINPATYAELNPILPQTSFSSTTNNNVEFKWATPHVKDKKSHIFSFTMQDDACPMPAKNNFTLVVNVSNRFYIPMDTAYVCDGDTIAIPGYSLSGTQQWSPAIDIINRDSSVALFYTDTSRYYYLTDSLNGNLIDSVYVKASPAPNTSLSFNGVDLVVSNSMDLDSYDWYYNGAKFNHFSDSLTPFASGLYWIEGFYDNCTFQSQALNLVVPEIKAFTYLDSLTGAGPIDSLIPLAVSIGAHFKVYNGNFTWLEGIEIAGGFQSTSTNTKVTFKLYDRASQLEMLSLDTLISSGNGVVRFSFPAINLVPQNEYSIKIFADSTLLFQAFHNLSVPYDPGNNGIIITGLSSGGSFKNSSSTQTTFLPIGMRFVNSIGESESISQQKISIYPNPVKSKALLLGMSDPGNSTIDIVDITGRNIEFNFDRRSNGIEIDFESIAPGIYFIRITEDKNERVLKIIKE